MVYLGFPYGSTFGWGVLGKEVALAMTELTEMRLLCPPKVDQRLADEFDLYRLRKLMISSERCGQVAGNLRQLDGPVILAAVGRNLEPFVPGLTLAEAGYAVFEESVLPQAAIAHAKRHYRHLATGSRYCAEVLRAHGLDSVSVIPHGVNSEVFCPSTEPRKILEGKFVVFSGGKFELRKGQDIVIRAFKILQDRHPDVILINSWHNSWAFNRDTMAGSSLIRYFPPKDDNHVAWMNALLATHGIDLDRVITVGPRDHRLLSQLYHASDLGLFPNRLEGGNNMVLMEFMACGKPVLVSYNSGHTEIVNRKNAVLIDTHRPMERRTGTELIAVWNDPSLEETIEKLEWCYHHRDALAALARQAAMDMREFSWQRLAKGLLELACSSRPS